MKFKHFEKADVTRYQEIWTMNGDTVAELVSNVLKADKVIHEQLLGLLHRSPASETFRSPLEEDAEQQQQEAEGAAGGAGAGAGGDAGEGAEGAGEDADQEAEEAAVRRRQLLAKQTKYGPLLEALQRQLPFMQTPASPGLDSLLTTLGVTNGASFDALVEGLAKEGGLRAVPAEGAGEGGVEADAAAALEGAAAEAGGEDREAPEFVLEGNDELLKALRRHLEKHGGAGAGGLKGADVMPPSALGANGDAAEALVRRLPQRMDREREYWERMSNVISQKMHRIWLVMKKELLGFNDILTKRGVMLTDIKELADQNAELRDLLNKYLSSKINEDLHIPPTQLLLV